MTTAPGRLRPGAPSEAGTVLSAGTAPTSVRELLTELAHLEDAERHLRATGGAGSGPPDPELARLVARQDQIIAALHSRSR